MRSPNHDAGEAGGLRFERRQISDAAFIPPAAVVDDENIACLRVLHCFEENIDAAEMPGWQGPAGEAMAGNQRGNSGRCDPKRNLQTQGRVGDERCGKFGEIICQQLVVHLELFETLGWLIDYRFPFGRG